MKTIFVFGGLLALFTGLMISTSSAQNPEDALRLAIPGIGVGARALGMGMAYTGIANDFSAAYWNPAGLGQIKANELSLGLSYLSYGDKGTLYNYIDGTPYGPEQSYTNSSTNFNSAGMVYPFPTTRGSLVFALGYGRQADFTTGLSFSGFNPVSSIAQYYAPDNGQAPQDPTMNIAWGLYLADRDSLSPDVFRWSSRIFDSLTQAGKVLESGGLSYVTGSLAFEAAKNLYLGATINFITGSYTYSRSYTESSTPNVRRDTGFAIQSFTVRDNIENDISGFTMKLGLLYKFAPTSRLGIAIQTPSWITVHAKYSRSGISSFYEEPFLNTGTDFSYVAYVDAPTDYDITTPFVFSGGISHSIRNLLLSGDFDYTDYTQLEFRNADQSVLDLNSDMKSIFRPTFNYRLGGEYAFEDAAFRLRGGFAYFQSPYADDPSSFAKKYITGGLGFIIENAIAIDLAYAYGFWDSNIVNYNYTSPVTEKITTHNLFTTVSYRF